MAGLPRVGGGDSPRLVCVVSNTKGSVLMQTYHNVVVNLPQASASRI